MFKSHKLSGLIMSDRPLWWIQCKNRNQKQTGLYGLPTQFLSECRVPHPRVDIMPHMYHHLSYTYYRKWGSRAIIVSLRETKCACTLILFSTYFQMRQLEKGGNQVSKVVFLIVLATLSKYKLSLSVGFFFSLFFFFFTFFLLLFLLFSSFSLLFSRFFPATCSEWKFDLFCNGNPRVFFILK